MTIRYYAGMAVDYCNVTREMPCFTICDTETERLAATWVTGDRVLVMDTLKYYRANSPTELVEVGGAGGGPHTHPESDIINLVTDLAGKAPTVHTHAESDVSGLVTDLAGKEPANANIQAHVTAQHAPSNAQKNSDILQSEIEAKLTGVISTHSHAGGGGGGYAINVQALTSSPTDGATVYFGMLPKAPTTTANISKVYIRKPGTITVAEIYCYSGTAGTAENWSLYIRKNNTTDTLIATRGVATNERVFSNTGLSIAMAAGDYFEIKGIQPTWSTNPLTTIYGGYVYIAE